VRSSTDHRGIRDRVVWRPERPIPHEGADRRGAGNGGDDRGQPSLVVVKRREETGHGTSQERFAGTGRTDHHQGMPAGESKLHGSPRFELAANLGQIRPGSVDCRAKSRVPPLLTNLGRHLDAGRPVACSATPAFPNELRRLRECRRGHDFDPVRETCFARALDRDHDPRDAPPRESCHHRQQAGDGTQLSAQGQLSENGPAAVRPDLLRSDENPEGHGQIKGGAALAHLRRCEVHGDPPRRILVTAVTDGAAHAFACFLERGVRQPDDGEPWQARGDVDFDPDWPTIQALKRG
jgi:hypothetical protein